MPGGQVSAWLRAGYKREQFARNCPKANFLREELNSLGSTFRPCGKNPVFAPKFVRTPPTDHRPPPQQSAPEPAVSFRPSDIVAWRENGAPATVSSRLLISALEKTSLPLPRSHRRSHRRRAAAASTAGHRRTRLPHGSLTVRARL